MPDRPGEASQSVLEGGFMSQRVGREGDIRLYGKMADTMPVQ